MQSNELTALLHATKEVAFAFGHVEVEVSNQRNRQGLILCPTNLVKGTVIENGFHWVEKRELAVCGDHLYEINRKNGVLVEVDLEDFPEYKERFTIRGRSLIVKSRNNSPYKHTEVITRDGKRYIRMITSRKAIFSSWGEYALEIAKREKKSADELAKREMLRNPQAEIMGLSKEDFDTLYLDGGDDRIVYLSANWEIVEYETDEEGHKVTVVGNYGWKDYVAKKEIGKIEITLDQANKILAMLTPKQKAALKVK